MRSQRSVLVAVLASAGLLTPSAALAGTASAGSAGAAGPHITTVSIRNESNSRIDPDGGFPVLVAGKVPKQGACTFRIWVHRGSSGPWIYLGDRIGEGSAVYYEDYITAAQLRHPRQYKVRAYDCDGNPGNTAYSRVMSFKTYDDQDQDSGFSGSWSFIASRHAFRRGYLSTDEGLKGWTYYYTHTSYAVGVYGETGPRGGVASVTVDGAAAPNISFYSATTKYRVLLYKAGWSTPGHHLVKFRVHSKGPGGGTDLYFDGANEFVAAS